MQTVTMPRYCPTHWTAHPHPLVANGIQRHTALGHENAIQQSWVITIDGSSSLIEVVQSPFKDTKLLVSITTSRGSEFHRLSDVQSTSLAHPTDRSSDFGEFPSSMAASHHHPHTPSLLRYPGVPLVLWSSFLGT